MAKPFHELRERLLRAGFAPRHVRRYLTELTDHLADLRAEQECAGRSRADAESAALIRLGGMDDLAKAMIEQRQFQSWCVRAPWAMFGLAPLFLLTGAYVVACSILWSGWKFFLPGANTPFVPLDGFAILYFGVGRLLYYFAPILIGWGIGLIAARQRFKVIWPVVGLVLIASIGGTAQVHASRPAVPGGVGHISMDLALGSSVQDISYSLIHALAILSLTVLPYLIWRLQKAYSLSA
ncbi:MAG TPA: permease prefix domain 1-containing protein [Terriglobales bacterium]|nr:permease prefix domain 1-containing protein [Terriglobales bacterium]